MSVVLTTAGVAVKYAVEETKGTRPTTNYVTVHDIKSTPGFNPEPETLETTDLSQTEYKTYTSGLKDLGGAAPFLVNLTTDFIAEWKVLIEAYKAAANEGKAIWFEICHPKIDDSVFFTGQPSELGLPEMSVNSVLEAEVYITPTNAPIWEAKSTT